jgi:serine/threonine-protein kinase
MVNSIKPEEILGDRYRILRELGHGTIEHTYLVEDMHRFNESCTLKKITFQIPVAEALQKIEELFERETKSLYLLKHPQISNFRAFFCSQQNGQKHFFLVQDYIKGQTYRQLLQARLEQGIGFTEGEVTQLLLQILPILDYIHNKGVIHRNISPDSLILRSSDQLPVLINFGGVKPINIQAESFLPEDIGKTNSPSITPFERGGYAPAEQIPQGIVFAHSDLYALAATILVLLTGKEPPQLMDPDTLNWDWTQEITLSPSLTRLLKKMLAQNPSDRFQTAKEVIRSLNENDLEHLSVAATQALEAPVSAIAFSPVPENDSFPTVPAMTSSASTTSNFLLGCLGKTSLALIVIVGSGVIGWLAGKAWLNPILKPASHSDMLANSHSPDARDTSGPSSQLTEQEWKRKTDLRVRRLNLGINNSFFQTLVDWMVSEQYPGQKEPSLNDRAGTRQWQERRDVIMAELLDRLSFLSLEARQGLGSYNQSQRDRWTQDANQLHLSSRTLYDLADAEFFYRFPEQTDREFIDHPIGQVWSAIVFDKLKALQSGKAYESLVIPAGVRETLKPGEGKVYITQLRDSQLLEVNLNADPNILLSIYSPTGKNNLLEDSTLHQWSGSLSETGFYEFVIVSKAKQPLNYQLDIRETE